MYFKLHFPMEKKERINETEIELLASTYTEICASRELFRKREIYKNGHTLGVTHFPAPS